MHSTSRTTSDSSSASVVWPSVLFGVAFRLPLSGVYRRVGHHPRTAAAWSWPLDAGRGRAQRNVTVLAICMVARTRLGPNISPVLGGLGPERGHGMAPSASPTYT